MRPSNEKIMDAAATNASQNSSAIWTNQVYKASFQAVVTGAASAGSLKVQVSNDQLQGYPNTSATPTNWKDVGSAVTVSGAGVYVVAAMDCCYQFMRVQYIDSSSGAGDGTCTIRAQTQGF